MKDNQLAGSPREAGKRRRLSPALLEHIEPNAAGIDCGRTVTAWRWREIAIRSRCVNSAPSPPTSSGRAEWLVKCGITTVAMESTGVYWIPIYEILEERGLEEVLVNARHLRNVADARATLQTVSGCATYIA